MTTFHGFFLFDLPNIMQESIRAIVFDAYGTLFNVNSLDGILADHFGQKSNQLSTLWRRKQLEYTWLRTLMGRYRTFSELTMDALKHSCQALELEYTNAIGQRLYREYLTLQAYPEVYSVLNNLAESVDLGVLSNANPPMLDGAIERNNLQIFFKHVLSADSISLFKPRPEIYNLACDCFQLAPTQILFVSSNTWDVSGAKSNGLQVAWLNRFDGTLEELDYQPDYILDEMKQLILLSNRAL